MNASSLFKRAAPLVGAAFCFLVCARGASAQDPHYQTFIVGEHAIGMGGAYTGVAEDPSAGFYNPAGLAHLRAAAVSGSLSVDAIDMQSIDNGYGSALGTTTLAHDSRPSVPLFASLVAKFGPKDRRVRRHAIAISTFHPTHRSRMYSVSLQGSDDAGRPVSDFLNVETSDQAVWFGPSYAYRVNPELAFGLSIFLSTRNVDHDENQTIVTQGAIDPETLILENASVMVSESRVRIEARHLVLRFGGIWAPAKRWKLGLMFQPPGIALGSEGSLESRRILSDSIVEDPYATYAYTKQQGLNASYPIPWEVRAGASYAIDEDWVIAGDVSVYGPLDSVTMLEARPDDFGSLPDPGLFFAENWSRDLVINASLGLDGEIAGMIPLRVGLFTDFSSAPSVPSVADTYVLPDVDLFGASLSGGISAGHYDISVGLVGLHGKGSALGLNPARSGSDAYVRRDAEETILYFFITGAAQAASRLAVEAYEEVFEEEDEPRRRRRSARPANSSTNPDRTSTTSGTSDANAEQPPATRE